MNLNSEYQNDLINFIFQKPGSRLASQQFPDVQRSIDMYRNNLFENAARALAITFPTVESLIGRKAFRGLVVKILQSESKTQFDWAEYGESFPICISEQEDLFEYPYLSEVAQYDWLVHQTQRLADTPANPASFNLLQEAPLDSLYFELNTGFSVKQFWFPVSQLHALTNDQHLTNEQKVSLQKNTTKMIHDAINLEHPRSLVVWRPEYKTMSEVVSDQDLIIYEMLEKGNSVADIFAQIETNKLDLSLWLTDIINSKKVVGIKQ